MRHYKVICCLLFTATIFAIPAVADLARDIEQLRAQFLPAELAKRNFTLDDAKRMLRKKCERVTGVDKPQIYDSLERAAVELIHCANELANITFMLDEVEVARPRGDLDVVFQKYCLRLPRAEQCLRDFNAQLLPCLTLKERAQNEVMMHVLTSLLSFVCYRDGEQIALFIAEDGPECLEANKDNIGNCMNATFAAYASKGGLADLTAVAELPELVLDSKQCIDLYDFEECVLGFLEQCNEITPSNIIESMFKYVKKETKCQPEIDKVVNAQNLQDRNDANNVWPNSIISWSSAIVLHSVHKLFKI